MITTRPARRGDAVQMTALLNEIIATGGTTAHQTPLTAEKMLTHYITPKTTVSCIVAVDDDEIIGFQSLEWPDPTWHSTNKLPADWADIATFARLGMAGRGIGTALFIDTLAAAKRARVATINATIRADNAGGLRYYSRAGFVDYKTAINVALKDGTLVDRVSKRFDLA